MDDNTQKWLTQAATHSWITMQVAKSDPVDYLTHTCIFCFRYIDDDYVHASHSNKCTWYVAWKFIEGIE